MAGLVAAGQAIGGVISAVGALASFGAKAAAARYQSQVDKNNQIIANRNRAAYLAQGDNEAADKMRENRQRMASIRASYGASGIDLAGTPLDVLNDTAIEGAMDVKRITYRAGVQATGAADTANQYAAQSRLDEMDAEDASIAGPISAVGSLFGGLTQAGVSLMRA